jgi:RNA polymerase sigma factor (sigma-70 family)
MTRTPTQTWLDELPMERPRLVRLCARLTGNYEAAEDLAQETLFEAWRQAANLRDVTAWRAFVTGIARNICLRWRRERGRESAFRAPDTDARGQDAFAALADSTLTAPDDLELSLEKAEIATLLDKAMAALPEGSRELLTERYVEDASPMEMAAKRGLTDNVLGVRLHRARLGLQKLLASPTFREDAASYGLISSDSADGWQETRLWCPRCGDAHLEGRFVTAEENGGKPTFAVRCPECERALGADFTTDHRVLPSEKVLNGVRGYKPALNRLSAWWNAYYSEGLKRGKIACPQCGREARMTSEPPVGVHPLLAEVRGAYIACSHCRHPVCISASGLAFHSSAVQKFWRDHPRIALSEERDVRFGNAEAVAVIFRSLTDSATLEVVLARDSFETLTVSSGTPR